MLCKKMIFASLLLFTLSSIHAQFEIGMKAGISSNNLSVGELIFKKGDTDISLANANYGHHFGLYTRVEFLNFYIEPSILFNSNKITYQLDEYSENPISTFANETYLDMNIPLLVGMKLGLLRVAAGPVAIVNLEKTSQLIEFNNYKEKIESTTYAYQLGLGLDLWTVRFDINYENNFSEYGDKISIGGADFSNNKNQSRWIATIGIKL